MTISQMSRLYGVSLRTLRFYEDRGSHQTAPRGQRPLLSWRGPRSDGDDSQGQEARLHPHRDQRPDRRQGRKRNARSRGAASAAADRQPDRPSGTAARAKSTAPSSGCARRTAACRTAPRPERPGRASDAKSLRPDPSRFDDAQRFGDGEGSIPRWVVSSRTASSAGRNGAAARSESRASRRRISARMAS